MTLDEAIVHAEEVAENKEKVIKLTKGNPMLSMSEKGITEYKKCINEHRQLAEWLRDYKKLKEQEPCIDAISREAVKEQMIKYGFHAPDMTVTEFVEDLPSVNPQLKTGHWIYKQYDGYPECGNWHCSECDEIDNRTSAYCPNCGAKMVEPQKARNK